MNNEDLIGDFEEFLMTCYPEYAWEGEVEIVWDESIGQYVLFLDGDEETYIDEEFIFQSGYKNYKRYTDYWKRYATLSFNSVFLKMLHTAVKTDDKVLFNSFVNCISCDAFDNKMILEQSIAYCIRNNKVDFEKVLSEYKRNESKRIANEN